MAGSKQIKCTGVSGLQGIERRRGGRRWSESWEYYKLRARYLAATVGKNGGGVPLSNIVTGTVDCLTMHLVAQNNVMVSPGDYSVITNALK